MFEALCFIGYVEGFHQLTNSMGQNPF